MASRKLRQEKRITTTTTATTTVGTSGRKQAKARPSRRLPSRAQMLWSGLSLLVLLGLVISTCAVPATT